MKLHTLAAVAALLASGLASAATVTVSAGAYSLTYDNATPGFGALTLTATGFEWSLQPVVQVTSLGAGPVVASFAIPDFTITANTGWTLGSLSSSLGNVVFFEAGPAASTSLTAGGTLQIDSNAAVTLPQMSVPKVGAGSGWFAGTTPLSGSFGTLSVSNASLVLTANAGANSFAAITGQPQNKLSYSFTATAVPEPESYALMLAGLGLVGFLARRRARR